MPRDLVTVSLHRGPSMVEQLAPQKVAAWLQAHAGAVLPLLLDVREPAECAAASIHPAGCILQQWSMQVLASRLDELDPQQPTLVMCHLGGRSQQVADFLDARGFCCVANLAGGIDAWAQQLDPGLARY